MEVYLIVKFIFLLYVTQAVLVFWHIIVVKFGIRDYPLDFNIVFIDNNRLIGDAKTLMGLLICFIVPTSVSFVLFRSFVGIYFGCGLYIGAVIAGFIKRRLNIKRGDPLIIIDQIDDVLGSFFILNLFGIYEYNEYFWHLVFISLILHPVLVFFTYKIGLRKRKC